VLLYPFIKLKYNHKFFQARTGAEAEQPDRFGGGDARVAGGDPDELGHGAGEDGGDLTDAGGCD
jgi:hypothetical protein